jgi:hypothetical protein
LSPLDAEISALIQWERSLLRNWMHYKPIFWYIWSALISGNNTISKISVNFTNGVGPCVCCIQLGPISPNLFLRTRMMQIRERRNQHSSAEPKISNRRFWITLHLTRHDLHWSTMRGK